MQPLEPFLGWGIGFYSAVAVPASQALITVILLISWLEPGLFQFQNRWDVVDTFAGAGRIARLARMSGQAAVALDLQYHPKSHVFDINENGGFVLLALRVGYTPFELQPKWFMAIPA